MKQENLKFFTEPYCICGHPARQHYTEETTDYFSGLFNPALAGHFEHHIYIYCDGGEDGCKEWKHQW